MPLDPNIVLRGLPPPTPLQSPLEALQLVEQLRARREQGEAQRALTEERRQAGEERRQKAADEAAARQRAAAVEQRVQGALIPHPVTGRPTLDWAKLLEGGEVPSAVLFKLGEETDQAATRLVELESANLDLGKKKTLMLGTLAQPVATAGFAKPAWDAALLAAFNKKLITAEERDAGYAITDPAAIQQATTDALLQAGLTPKPSELQKITTVDAEGREVTQFVTPTEGASYPVAPPKPATAPAVGSFEDYVVRRYGPTPTPAQITQARKDYQQADDRPRITVNTGGGSPTDVKDIVQGMMDGTLPPQLPGRASPTYNAIMAEAKRRGFNLATAVTDWQATTKHIATMNGAQQLRLNQAVNALPEMLDKVDTLATQWKGTGAPLLNRANLALAKNGVYGAKAAGLATQLDAQIADVVADLGNVYMGGNSPTDHALQLAGKSLQADWSEPVLRQMVKLAKENVQIRRNSINSTGVAGASAENPYMPAPATEPAPGMPKVGERRSFNGRIGEWDGRGWKAVP